TRAADCRHNRSCLRCNSRENHGSDGVPFLHEVLLSIIFRLNPVAAYRVKPILQACHSCSICQTRTFAQSVYRSHQPTAFADLISSTDLVREFKQLRRIVLARGSQSAFSSGLRLELMLSLLLGRSSLKLRESLYLTKRQTIYRSDRNSVRCRTFPATSASHGDRLRVPDALRFGRPHTRALPQSRSCSE